MGANDVSYDPKDIANGQVRIIIFYLSSISFLKSQKLRKLTEIYKILIIVTREGHDNYRGLEFDFIPEKLCDAESRISVILH